MEQPLTTPREATAPKPTPLTEQQKQNYQRTIERDREERAAAKNSKPTVIAGCWVLAGVMFELITGFLGNHIAAGGLLYLIAGIFILKGKQGCLRFTVLVSAFGLLIGVATMAWSAALQIPVLAGNRWFSPGQPAYWSHAVIPAVLSAIQIFTGTRALRHRQLPFWTRAVRWGAVGMGVIVLINAGVSFARWQDNRQLGINARAELDNVRSYFHDPGDGVQERKRAAQFKEFPRIQSVGWRTSTDGAMTTYTSTEFQQDWKEIPRYTEFFKDPSEGWIKWEVRLSNP